MRDRRIDAYIVKAAPFAQPILEYFRAIVHEGCPDVQETMKWSMPHFEHHGLLCSMAAFKQHCAFNFWKGALLKGRGFVPSTEGMGQFGKVTAITDLPSRAALKSLVKEAAALNETGTKVPRERKAGRAPLRVPSYFSTALRRNVKAAAAFETLSPSHRREYVEWITSAKTEETRARRLAKAVEWISEGKSQNWRYERK